MKAEIIQKLCCPFDKAELELKAITKNTEGDILEGFFTCGKCKRIYPIVKGIPIMNPDEYRESKLEKPLLEQWKHHMKDKDIEGFRLIEK